MRLLLVDKEYPPNPHGGIGTYNRILAGLLGKAGHFVVVLSATSDGSLRLSRQPYGLLYRIPHRPPSRSLASYLRWTHQCVFGLKIVPHALKLVERFGLDLVEIPSTDGYGAYLARRLKGQIPIITRFHGCLGRIPIDKAGNAALNLEMRRVGVGSARRRLYRAANRPLWWQERSQIVNSDWVTYPSSFSRRWLTRAIGPSCARFPVIPNGVDVAGLARYRDSRPKWENDDKRIAFVGRCSVGKGAAVLARAAPSILGRCPDASIICIGAPADPRVTRSLWRLADLYPGRIQIMGRLPRKQVMSELSRSALLVHPSFHEISPMVVLEAMALGVPAVVSNVGPLPEIVKHGRCGMLFAVGDEGALAESVITLLNADEVRRELSTGAVSRVQEAFDLREIAADLVDSYNRLTVRGAIEHDRPSDISLSSR